VRAKRSERNAIVIDHFFDTKEKALAWAKANRHFIMVRVLTPDIKEVARPPTYRLFPVI
jgi:DNA modification methylase